MSSFSESSEDSLVELCILTIKECFVYKVPPLRTASGHRAEDWNLANPLLTGCLKLYQRGDTLRLVIYSFKDVKNSNVTEDNIQVFGECPIAVKPGENILNFVDAVIDSSRYYVVRIKDPKSSRTTLIGVGFRERDDAFDLKNSLNDYVKFINRMDLASQLAAASLTDALGCERGLKEGGEGEAAEVDGAGGEYLACSAEKEASGTAPAAYAHIPSLKEGEKIKISIGGKGRHTGSSSSSISSAGAGAGGGPGTKGTGMLLKPPPPAGSIVHFQGGEPVLHDAKSNTANTGTSTTASSSAGATAGADEDWGDFA